MWIRNPLKTVMVNTEQICMICLSYDGKEIRARTREQQVDNNGYILLGEYIDKRSSSKVMKQIAISMQEQETVYNMPTQEELND